MKFQELTRLHGTAWLAIDKWVSAVLGEKRLEELDGKFKGCFYPPEVIEEARQKMKELFKDEHK